MPDERAERIAVNESRFRGINEKLRNDLGKLPEEPATVAFVCECGRAECKAVLELAIAEYEAIRANPRRFIARDGHEFPDVERVVAHTSGYVVIEKLPDTGPLVDATDPRRGRP